MFSFLSTPWPAPAMRPKLPRSRSVVLLLVTVLACQWAVCARARAARSEEHEGELVDGSVLPSRAPSQSTSVSVVRSHLRRMRFVAAQERVHTGFDKRVSKDGLDFILSVPLHSQQFVAEGTGANKCRNTWYSIASLLFLCARVHVCAMYF